MLLRSNEKAVRAKRKISEEIDEYCPLIKGACIGTKCLNVKRGTHSWTNEGCMGGETHHSYDYLYCKEYPDTVVWHLQVQEEPYRLKSGTLSRGTYDFIMRHRGRKVT